MSRVPRRVPQMLATLAIVAVAILAFSFYVGRNVGSTPGAAPTPTPGPSVSAAPAACGSLTFGPALTPTAGNAGKKSFSAPPPMAINTAHHFLVTIKTAKASLQLLQMTGARCMGELRVHQDSTTKICWLRI